MIVTKGLGSKLLITKGYGTKNRIWEMIKEAGFFVNERLSTSIVEMRKIGVASERLFKSTVDPFKNKFKG